MELPEEVQIYFFNHSLGILDTRTTKSSFVYIKTSDRHPIYRYSLKNPELLQHKLGRDNWSDIWLSIRREQTALF
jgi:hypothetical protein